MTELHVEEPVSDLGLHLLSDLNMLMRPCQ